MPIPQTLGNDEVEGAANRICGGMTENALRARVPETNNAFRSAAMIASERVRNSDSAINPGRSIGSARVRRYRSDGSQHDDAA